MTSESVICPSCGTQILATVPLGQQIMCVSLKQGNPAAFGAKYRSASRCTNCKKSFTSYTNNKHECLIS
ncbi:hypothetical protein [uncultured Methanomethylovorans sp.]|uniref:hypothetical protein n=1 Tax=uncultured Methanomethylovorans sp. TaxID=183759 RepID=UPI002624198C|nr:hypothetical protein [uncultured Methanomethylovorans sp.]